MHQPSCETHRDQFRQKIKLDTEEYQRKQQRWSTELQSECAHALQLTPVVWAACPRCCLRVPCGLHLWTTGAATDVGGQRRVHGTWQRMPHMAVAAGFQRQAGLMLYPMLSMPGQGCWATANGHQRSSTISSLSCRASAYGVCALDDQSLHFWAFKTLAKQLGCALPDRARRTKS